MSKTIAGREMPTLNEYLERKLADPEFALEYEEMKKAIRCGVALSWLRESRGLTQRELAEKTGIKQPQIARIEGGQMPEIATLEKLLTALNGVMVLHPDGRIVIEPAESWHKAA